MNGSDGQDGATGAQGPTGAAGQDGSGGQGATVLSKGLDGNSREMYINSIDSVKQV